MIFARGIEIAVHRVAEAHQPVALVPGLGGLDEARAVVALVVDRLEHLHDRAVGAAVQRAREGADPGRNAR